MKRKLNNAKIKKGSISLVSDDNFVKGITDIKCINKNKKAFSNAKPIQLKPIITLNKDGIFDVKESKSPNVTIEKKFDYAYPVVQNLNRNNTIHIKTSSSKTLTNCKSTFSKTRNINQKYEEDKSSKSSSISN